MPPKARTPIPGARHGTPIGYYGDGCRCDPCRAANRTYSWDLRQRRAKRVAAGLIEVPHGYNGYCNYNCRCDICSTAAIAVRAKKKQPTQEENAA
jgi:hypothetical protein